MTAGPFDTYRVLVLEDEPLISMLTEDMVIGQGGTVIGPFSRVATARQEVANGAGHISLALLDVNLNGERSTGFASELRALGVPVVFCTGYDEAGIEEQWRSTPRLRKPFSEAELVDTVATAMTLNAERDAQTSADGDPDDTVEGAEARNLSGLA